MYYQDSTINAANYHGVGPKMNTKIRVTCDTLLSNLENKYLLYIADHHPLLVQLTQNDCVYAVISPEIRPKLYNL